MKEKVSRIVTSHMLVVVLIFAMEIGVVVAILQFGTHDESSNNKGDVFDFILETNMEQTTVLPGESFVVKPVIISNYMVGIYRLLRLPYLR